MNRRQKRKQRRRELSVRYAAKFTPKAGSRIADICEKLTDMTGDKNSIFHRFLWNSLEELCGPDFLYENLSFYRMEAMNKRNLNKKEVQKCVQFFCGEWINCFGMVFVYDDENKRELKFKAETINRAMHTGILINPETGEQIIDFKKKVRIYFKRLPLFMKMVEEYNAWKKERDDNLGGAARAYRKAVEILSNHPEKQAKLNIGWTIFRVGKRKGYLPYKRKERKNIKDKIDKWIVYQELAQEFEDFYWSKALCQK